MKFVKGSRNRSDMSLPRTAIHEAGHACAAIYLDRSVHYAQINRRSKHGGVSTKGKRRHEDPMRLALTCLAGDAAERCFYPRKSRHQHSYGDMREVVRMGYYGQSIDTLIMHADGLAHALRKPIRRVADALLERGKLSSREIHALYRGKEVIHMKKKKGGRPC